VVEHVEDADTWTSSLPPGVLAVDENDEGGWGVVPSDSNAKPRSNAPAHGSMMDVDPELPSYTPERPQVGPGVMVRRFLEQIHPHPLYRPVITDLPQAAPLKTPVLPVRSLSTSDEGLAAAAPAPAPETEAPPPSLTLDEVYASLPGGKAQQNEWYFCPDCWGWFHISHHDVEDPPIIMPWTRSGLNDEAQTEFQKEMGWYRDLTTARGTSEHNDVHMHAFRNLVGSTAANETRIERINVPGHVDKFSHLELGEDVERYRTWPTMTDDPATLYASCTSDHWVFVDQGPVPGQLPVALVREFTAEKQGNPQPGKTANDSAAEAWSLVVT
jgi:ubiquitin carboxyl-terminal hydrolase 25/28